MRTFYSPTNHKYYTESQILQTPWAKTWLKNNSNDTQKCIVEWLVINLAEEVLSSGRRVRPQCVQLHYDVACRWEF